MGVILVQSSLHKFIHFLKLLCSFYLGIIFATQLCHCDDNANEKSDSDDAEGEEDVLVPQRNRIPEPVPPLLHLVHPLVLKLVHQSTLFHLDQVVAEEFQKLWVAIQ